MTIPKMKQLQLPVAMDLSEAALTVAFDIINEKVSHSHPSFVLITSVFDASQALNYMVRNDGIFRRITEVTLSRYCRWSEWELRSQYIDPGFFVRSEA